MPRKNFWDDDDDTHLRVTMSRGMLVPATQKVMMMIMMMMMMMMR